MRTLTLSTRSHGPDELLCCRRYRTASRRPRPRGTRESPHAHDSDGMGSRTRIRTGLPSISHRRPVRTAFPANVADGTKSRRSTPTIQRQRAISVVLGMTPKAGGTS